MNQINLRTYIQEIDELIEEGQQLEEAIAHCRHILKSYPKHIDTYRMLGKAYLESKRFGDAGDIFQRVLSAIPNDFVSHVGMAIIREDEGNLDAAIWHMERSSESQPGNAAIEEELKRLIGKRDGIEPQRVRPTRGALARMYYHGELYSYAISELQTALEEDPDRPDLQLLLADTFWRTGQRLEAADLCGQILEKLPYCFLANQITATLLQASGKPEESAINLRRLIALDPYMAFIETPMDSPANIDASAIQLDKIAWIPGQPLPSSETAQPDWAASLGVDLRGNEAKTADREDMPSWLKSPASTIKEGQPKESPAIHPFAGAKPPPGADIPDWMRESGWVESSGEATEGPSEFVESYGTEAAAPSMGGPLTPADLPSWLREISPEKPVQEEAFPVSRPPSIESRFPPEEEDTQGLPDWIQGAKPSEEEEELEHLSLTSEKPHETDMPSFEFEPSEPEFPEEAEATGIEEGKVESIEEEIPEYPPWLEPSTPGATDTITSWLGEKSLGERPSAEDIPTWMRGTGPLEEPSRRIGIPSKEELPEEAPAEPTPAFEDVSGLSEEVEVLFSKEEMPTGDTPAEQFALDWLDRASEVEEPFSTQEEVPSGEAPEWLREEALGLEEVPSLEEVSPPSWLEDMDEEYKKASMEDLGESMEAMEPQEKPPDWLSEIIREDFLDEEEIIVEKPDWLAGVVDADSIIEQGAAEEIEEAPEWLTEISMVEEVDTSPISEDKEEPPEWLKGLVDTEIAPEEEVAVEAAPPDWVTKESFPEPEEEHTTVQETQEWLQELTKPTPGLETAPEIEVSGEASVEELAISPPVEKMPPQAEIPDWLEELALAPAEGEPILEEPKDEIHEPAIAEAKPADIEIPNWLEELSGAAFEGERITEAPLDQLAELSAEAEALPTAEQPIELEALEEAANLGELVTEEEVQEKFAPSEGKETIPAEEAPDWLQEMVSAAGEEIAIEEPAQEIIESIPEEELEAEPEAVDWLEEISQAPSEIEPLPESVIPTDQTPVQPEDIKVREQEAFLLPEEEAPESHPPAVEAVSFKETPDWLQELSEAPSDLEIEALEEVEGSIEEAFPSEPVDVAALSEVVEETAEAEMTVEELAEEETRWQPEAEVPPVSTEEIGVEFPKATLEESFDWLQESALEVAPEPDQQPEPVKPSYAEQQIRDLVTSIEEPLDDEEVFSFLDQLAAREEVEIAEPPLGERGEAEPTLVIEHVEGKLIEEHALPEELDESLDWLEQLASEEPIEDFSPPIFEESLEGEEETEIPEWLEEVAERPEQIDLGEISVEEVEGIEEKTEEPAIPSPQPSTIETMISERPIEEDTFEKEPVEEYLEEESTEPLPAYPRDGEHLEGIWTLEAAGETEIAEEVPLEIPESEPPAGEFLTIEPEPAHEEISPEAVMSREESKPLVEEPAIDSDTVKLSEARRALERGHIEDALGHYSDLIKEKVQMTTVIQDLRSAIEKTPREAMLWQILGDALMKAGQLSDAIDAYRRGMEAV